MDDKRDWGRSQSQILSRTSKSKQNQRKKILFCYVNDTNVKFIHALGDSFVLFSSLSLGLLMFRCFFGASRTVSTSNVESRTKAKLAVVGRQSESNRHSALAICFDELGLREFIHFHGDRRRCVRHVLTVALRMFFSLQHEKFVIWIPCKHESTRLLNVFTPADSVSSTNPARESH